MRSIRTAVLIAATLLASAGCSGDAPLSPDAAGLVGKWVIVTHGSEGLRHERRQTFGADGSYAFESRYFGGRWAAADQEAGHYRSHGTFRVQDGVLMVQVVRSEEWWRHAGEPSVTWQRPEWVERGTVRVDGDRLVHTYIAAPLDAPQTFTDTYERER